MYKKHFSELSNRTLIVLLKLLPDILVIILSGIIALKLRFDTDQSTPIKILSLTNLNYLEFILVLIFIWILLITRVGAYQNRHISLFINNFKLIIRPSINLFLGIGFFSYITKAEFSRAIFIGFFLIGIFLLILSRFIIHTFLIRKLVMRKKIYSSILLVGSSKKDLESYANWIMENNKLGYKITDRLICNEIDFDWIEEFDKRLKLGKFSEVVLLPGVDTNKNFTKFVHYLQDLSITINWIPNDSGNLGYWQIPYLQEGTPFLTFKEPKIPFSGQIFKRLFDVLFSISFIILFFPIYLIIAILISIKDGRPVFFSQLRIGRNGKSFKMLKFRTMVKNAEEVLPNVENKHGGDHILFKNNDDPRVTTLGKLLRRYSLDELPQFFNSLVGDISIVGPRPALPRETAAYSSLYERRLLVKPGITGPWQISGRSDLDLKTSIALDLNYVVNWSFMGDLFIIINTPAAILGKKGAY